MGLLLVTTKTDSLIVSAVSIQVRRPDYLSNLIFSGDCQRQVYHRSAAECKRIVSQ